MSEIELLDKTVSTYLSTPEGVEFVERLKIRRQLMEPMEKIRSNASKRLVGMSHGGTMQFAGCIPQTLYFSAKQMLSTMPDKELQNFFLQRYPVFRAEG